MTGGKIENGLERGFVKHHLNYLLITDPMCLAPTGMVFESFWSEIGYRF